MRGIQTLNQLSRLVRRIIRTVDHLREGSSRAQAHQFGLFAEHSDVRSRIQHLGEQARERFAVWPDESQLGQHQRAEPLGYTLRRQRRRPDLQVIGKPKIKRKNQLFVVLEKQLGVGKGTWAVSAAASINWPGRWPSLNNITADSRIRWRLRVTCESITEKIPQIR